MLHFVGNCMGSSNLRSKTNRFLRGAPWHGWDNPDRAGAIYIPVKGGWMLECHWCTRSPTLHQVDRRHWASRCQLVFCSSPHIPPPLTPNVLPGYSTANHDGSRNRVMYGSGTGGVGGHRYPSAKNVICFESAQEPTEKREN